MPTAANVFELPDADAHAIGNWTKVPKGKFEEKANRGRAKELMSYRVRRQEDCQKQNSQAVDAQHLPEHTEASVEGQAWTLPKR
jgi:hypothetical protein